ncbi:MAG: hypothetical protein P4M11_15660 [Candidatus Pacebacteria bacterium]|nr:hypothetical protein [Candidatus Paceibacterota bacterium]
MPVTCEIVNGTLLFTDKATQDLIDTFDDERVQFLNVVNGISWGKAMAMIFILLLVFVVVFISFLRQLKEEISLTKAMMKMIPVDLLQANTKLLHKVLRGSA